MFPAFSRIWVINILLAAFVVFFGMMSFDVWSKGDETIPEMQTGKNPEKPLPGKGIIERKMPPDSTYSIVAEKNLFSSNRSEVVPEKPTQKSGPLKISEKTIFLYGVVVMGDHKKALISNPETGPEAGKKRVAKEKWVALGDTLGNFSVADIQKDRIILADGANTHEILLYDKNKPARKIIAPEKAELRQQLQRKLERDRRRRQPPPPPPQLRNLVRSRPHPMLQTGKAPPRLNIKSLIPPLDRSSEGYNKPYETNYSHRFLHAPFCRLFSYRLRGTGNPDPGEPGPSDRSTIRASRER